MIAASHLKLQRLLSNLIVFFAAVIFGGLADQFFGHQHAVFQIEQIISLRINANPQLGSPIGEHLEKAPDPDCLEKKSPGTNGNGMSGRIGSDKKISGYSILMEEVSNSIPFQILSKPRPSYTAKAKECLVHGKVRLRITFKADASIGTITPIQGLPHGLTERAVGAARKIRFKPEIRNGNRVAVRKTIAYNFTIY